MTRRTNYHLNIGELVVCAAPATMTTLLGSCISVCLFSKKTGAGGVNHYALPTSSSNITTSEQALRYGDTAIEMLIEHLCKMTGESTSDFVAKIVGGANVLGDKNNRIGIENIEIAEKILQKHGIPIVGRDVGGNTGRKIIFHTESGRLQVALLNEDKPATSTVSLSKKARKRKVLIIDDSKVIRDLLSRVLSQSSDLEVVGTAADPIIAEKMIYDLKPDVLTLDIHMPRMDGITFLEKFLPKKKIPVVMITSLSIEDGGKVLKALELGAVDYIQKPSLKELAVLTPIIQDKVKTASFSKVRIAKEKSSHRVYQNLQIDHNIVLAIGASTGGTEAIKDVLTHLPKEIPPTLIVQHIPPVFSKAFADRLNGLCAFEVKEAEDGDLLRSGLVLIAPGGKQMTIRKVSGKFRVVITDDAPMNRHKPSVDYLFNDVADLVGSRAVGLILTGMGADGAKGLLKMRQAGARTLSQDEETSVVYGMPKVAFEIGGSEEVLALDQISERLLQLFEKKQAA